MSCRPGRAVHDGVDVDELEQPVAGQLAAVAGVLDAAGRQSRVGGGHAVDRGMPGVQPGRERLSLVKVGGPDGAGQPVSAMPGRT